METYLRIYSNQQQDNWVSLLPMAQLAYNNKLLEATGTTPFFANHRQHPNLFTTSFPSIKAELAMITASKLKKVHEKAKENIKSAQRKAISYVNQKRKTAPQLKKSIPPYQKSTNLTAHQKVGSR
jgi:hypothetical protein